MNLIVFTAVNALWLRPLPFPDADRLVTIPGADVTTLSGSWREPFGNAVAGQVVTDRELRPQIRLHSVGRPLEVVGVTDGYFRLLGLHVRGRDFVQEDDREGTEPVAIVSDRLWARHLARHGDVIGSVIDADPFPIRIVGVAPAGFEGARRGERTDLWIPAHLVRRLVPAKIDWSRLPMMLFARLPPGRTIGEIERQIHDRMPNDRARAALDLVPLKDVFGTPESRTIVIREANAVRVVGGLATLVLAGGCATLAALVLVHYERRRLELAIKTALGATRTRLMRDLSAELLLIAAVGTLGAMAVAGAGLQVIPPLSLPGGVDLGRLDLSPDWRVFGAAILIATATLSAAACIPVLRVTRGRIAGEMLAGLSSTTAAASQRLRQTLLGGLVCAAVVVLVAAALFVRAVSHGFGGAAGFDVDRTVFVTAQVVSPWADHGSDLLKITAARTTALREALRAVPGVEQIVEGRPPIDPEASLLRRPIVVETGEARQELFLGRLDGGPELLSALGVSIVTGRSLGHEDGSATPLPAVLTSSLAHRLFPNDSPLGKVLTTSWRGGRLVVVGVASDFVFGSLARPATGTVVTATKDFTYGIEPRFIIRTQQSAQLVEPIHAAAKAALPDLSWVQVSKGRDLIARDLGRQRLGAWFFSGFGLTALILGIGGVFGLVAYLAESRQREFGVRLALGATARDLIAHGLKAALIPVSIGVATGCLIAAIASQVFAALLTGLSPLDPLAYGTVAVLMLACATASALSAAWRLRRMAPTDALRTN